MAFAEKLVKDRRNRVRSRKLDVTRYKVRPEVNYEIKNAFVENNIENAMLYFKPCNLENYLQ